MTPGGHDQKLDKRYDVCKDSVMDLYDEDTTLLEDDLTMELWQDDGETTYFCSPEHCAYEGDGVCSNCGFERDEE